MKSPMIENADYIPDTDKSGYSELQVMSSAAGYYIGTEYYDAELGFSEPGSRDSDYFKTRAGAEAYLFTLQQVGQEVMDVVAPNITRKHP